MTIHSTQLFVKWEWAKMGSPGPSLNSVCSLGSTYCSALHQLVSSFHRSKFPQKQVSTKTSFHRSKFLQKQGFKLAACSEVSTPVERAPAFLPV